MTTVTRSIVIKAPVEKVFSFVVSPGNWMKYVTSLSDVKDVSSKNVEPGTTFVWEYRMLGVKLTGKGTVLENEKNSRFRMKMEGGFPITETYAFTQVNGGTKLNVDIEYETPGKVMSVISKSSVVEKLNQREADAVLDKIKMLCEEL